MEFCLFSFQIFNQLPEARSQMRVVRPRRYPAAALDLGI